MSTRLRLWFGPLAAALLCVGMVGLARLVPGYDPVRQTVSEIGEVGSPARLPFAAMLCAVAACLLVFASAIGDLSRARGRPAWAAYAIGFMAVPAAGIGIFAYPHPLHNVFGLAELAGYQAPLALAIAWRGVTGARAAVRFSWAMAVVVWIAILLNLVTLHRYGPIWELIAPVYGLVQRSLFAAWFIWSAVLGLILLGDPRFRPASPPETEGR